MARRSPSRTFERTIWRSTSAVVVVAVALSGLVEAFFTYRTAMVGASDTLASEASWANALLTERFARTEQALRDVARLPWGGDGYGERELVAALGNLHSTDSAIESAGYLARGIPAVVMNGLIRGKPDDDSLRWAKEIDAVPLAYGSVRCTGEGVTRGGASATLACYTKSTEADSIVAANVRTNGFSEALSTINVSRDTHISVVDSKGRLLAHSIQAFAATNTVVDEEHSSATMNRGVVWAQSHGVVVLRAVERNRRTGFTVYAEYPRERVFAEIPNILFRTAILIAAATAIAMWVARVRAKALAEPAVKLAHSARSIAAGDLSVRVAESGVSEMREVGATFNTMAERLQRSHAQMEQEVADKTRDLANANAALEVASQHKSDFLAHMSHELRTPLNAVIGFSEMLKAQYFGPLNDKQAEYVRDINASGQHLLSLINDILDLAKVEAGRMELVRSDVHLPSLVESCCSLVSERFARKSQTLDAVVDPVVSFWTLDERKVKQCVLNLLSNANKFTPDDGRVSLSVAVEVGALVVRVADTGVGIAPEALTKLFTEFYQVAPTSAAAGGAATAQSTDAREGTGLGLALTRKFVELHGGTVEVASEVGKGSTFTLRFPAVATADVETAVLS